MENNELSLREKRRYTHQISLEEIGEQGQLKIKQAKILVVGTGGIGSPLLQYLTATGFGHIGIVDDDIVSEENLQRQILYGDSDLGKLKTIIARQKLDHNNSLVNHEIINIRITENNAKSIVERFDLVVDATDNFKTKYLLNDVCKTLGKVYIFGGIHKYEGQVTVCHYQGGPGLRDIFPNPPEANTKIDGIYGLVPGMVGLIQANETIKVVTDMAQPLSGKLLMINVLNYELDVISFP